MSKGGSGATKFSVLISGVSDVNDPNSPSQESSIDFTAAEMMSGAIKSGSAGMLDYSVTITQADVQIMNGGPYYNMDTVGIVVNVALRANE